MQKRRFLSNIRVSVKEDYAGDAVDVYIIKYGANNDKAVLQIRGDKNPADRHFWKPVEEGKVLPSPTFRISSHDYELRELFISMTEEYRSQDRDAELEALKRHLIDMRALLFQHLGADDPYDPLIVKEGLPYHDMELLHTMTGKVVIPENIIQSRKRFSDRMVEKGHLKWRDGELVSADES